MMSTRFSKRQELLLIVFLLGMTFSNVLSAVKLAPQLRNGYQDFTIFYSAARMVRSGQSGSLYDLPSQYRSQQEFAPNVRIRQAALPYNHPPFEALLFLPLTFLSYSKAYLLWDLLNGTMILAGLVLLRRQFVSVRKLPGFLVVLVATGFPPIARAMIQGQDSILLLFLFVIALVAMDRGHDAIAGAALAAGLFKFHLILPMIFLLLIGTRRWRLLLGFVPLAAVLVGVSFAMVGWNGLVDYVKFLLQLEKSGAGGAIVGGNMPNLRGIVSSVIGALDKRAAMPVTILGSAVLLVFAWRRMLSIRDSTCYPFMLATVITILVSYHTLTYDLSLLLPVVLLLVAGTGRPLLRGTDSRTLPLVLAYLGLFCEPFWPHVNQFCWPVLILSWFYWMAGNDPGLESDALVV